MIITVAEEGPGLGCDLAGDLAHRRQQRQAAALVDDRLVGDAGGAGLGQPTRQLGVRRQVQIGEQQVVGAQHRHLLRLRLLDSQDQLGLLEHAGRVGRDARALGGVLRVRDRRTLARPGLNDDLMTVLDQFPRTRRRQRHPVLVGLDLRRNSNFHVTNSLALKASQNSIRSRALDRSLPVSCSTRLIL
jgi:hypothetical protein